MKTFVSAATVFTALAILLASYVAPLAAQDKYAVLIGVESYNEEFFSPLDYSEDDALALSQSMTQLGFETQVITSQSRSSRLKPNSPEKIVKALRVQMANCMSGDTMIVSLSGHGIQFADEPLDAEGTRETYFCPEDADPNDKSTLLPISQVIDMLAGCEASRKLLLIDACRNEFDARSGQNKAGRKIELEAVHEVRRNIPGGMTVMFSCDQDQFSWEHDQLGHSVFSYFVINYLNGKAQSHYYEDNQVNLDNLTRYVRKQTNKYVSENNLSSDGQSPVLRGNGADWIIGRSLNPVRVLLQKHLDFVGGEAALRQVSSHQFQGTLSATNSQGKVSQLQVEYRGSNQNTGFIYSYNGRVTSKTVTTPEGGWVIDHQGATSELSESDNWGNQLMMRYPLSALTMFDQIHEFAMGEVIEIGGVRAQELIQTDNDSNTIHWYIADNGQLLKIKSDASGVASEFVLSKFKNIDGINVPTMEQTYSDGKLQYTTVLSDLRFNSLPASTWSNSFSSQINR